ncbi:hypothetical protein KI387_013493 [Taxus chinensis]|uniref:Mitochondrial carrier protein n=1 Tax=Taxus chinensis TaxID=29808 RepID=A0AA38CK30_TAXCH|nr:hypothetical protein KI387_013493 [Taxus chinensis]
MGSSHDHTLKQTAAKACTGASFMAGNEGPIQGFFLDMPLYIKELIAGGTSGGIAKTAVAPLERIKILFQTRHGEFQSMGVWRSLVRILQTEGVSGLYRGNGASVARIVPYAALHFMTYEQYRRWIIDYYPGVGTGPIVDLLAGSLSGGTAVICTYPLDLARTRLAYQLTGSYNTGLHNKVRHGHLQPAYRGMVDVFANVYGQSGLRGLYRGVVPSLYGIFPYAGLKFYVFEELKRHIPKEHEKSVSAKLACGALAGLVGQTITYPLDVVRRQMQVQTLSATKDSASSLQSMEHEFKGTWDGLITIVQRQGWKQLFSGLSINYVKVVPTVAIGFAAYDGMKSFLGIPSRENSNSQRKE